jgi:hypothetical protein
MSKLIDNRSVLPEAEFARPGLIYATDEKSGIGRRRSGRGFRFAKDGERITEETHPRVGGSSGVD